MTRRLDRCIKAPPEIKVSLILAKGSLSSYFWRFVDIMASSLNLIRTSRSLLWKEKAHIEAVVKCTLIVPKASTILRIQPITTFLHLDLHITIGHIQCLPVRLEFPSTNNALTDSRIGFPPGVMMDPHYQPTTMIGLPTSATRGSWAPPWGEAQVYHVAPPGYYPSPYYRPTPDMIQHHVPPLRHVFVTQDPSHMHNPTETVCASVLLLINP